MHADSAPSGPVIGLQREREVLTVALGTYRHVVLQGPGTGRATLLRAVAAGSRGHGDPVAPVRSLTDLGAALTRLLT